MEHMNDVKDKIIKMYPNITFKNQLFFDESVLEDFSLEDIAFNLSQLDSDIAWNLKMYLYSYGTVRLDRQILIYLAKNDISYFNVVNDEIYESINLITEYEKVYGNNIFSLDDLRESISLNESNNCNKQFFHFDISHINTLIMIRKIYKDKMFNTDEVKSFISFISNLLENDIVKMYGNYDNKYQNCINEVISYLINGEISLFKYYDGMMNNNKVLNLLLYGKFKEVNNVNKISLEVLGALSSKKVMRIYNSLLNIKLLVVDNKELMNIAINMCAMLGYDNVDNIIKHFPKDIKKILRLLYAFKNVDISRLNVKGGKIDYNEAFINYFLGDNIQEPNSLLNMIYNGMTTIDNNLETLYYSFDVLVERYKMQDLLTKTAFFEKKLQESKYFFNPDEYVLEGKIVNSYFDDRKYQSLSMLEVINRLKEYYFEMKHKYQKSIPYVCGKFGDYYYETLKANDPSIFSIGSETKCCFKIGGQGDSFVRYCTSDKNGRVVAIKDKSGEVVAMIPMVRNGNLIVCNSIESKYYLNDDFMREMFEILENVGQEMINISLENEHIDDRIQAILCGNYLNRIENFGKYSRVDFASAFDKVSPLDDSVICNLGLDICDCFCIKSIDKFKFNEARVFDPSCLYNDPRAVTKELEVDYIDKKMFLEIQKKIDAMAFESNYQKVDIANANIVVFNEDWFIVIDKQNHIYSSIVGNDPRASLEYFEYLELEKEYCKYYDQYGIFNNEARGR